MSTDHAADGRGGPFDVRSAGTRMRSGSVVGVDVGRRTLLALAPADVEPDLRRGCRVDGDAVVRDYQRLCERFHAGDALADGHITRLWSRVDAAADAAVDYLASFDGALLVLEDLNYPDRSLAECVAADAEPENWVLPAAHTRLVSRARDAGVPVAVTDPEATTRQCHVCGCHMALSDGTGTCSVDRCPVDEVDRDLSAAATIARRFL